MSRRAALAGVLATAILASCGGGGDPDPCAIATAGARWLAFTSAEQGSWDVEVIRADGSCRRAVTRATSRDLHPAWGPRGLLAYDSDRDPGPGIWLQDVATGAERRLDLGDLGATSPAFSPDGASLAFEGRALGTTEGSIYVVPAAGGTPRLLTPDAPGSTTPHPSGNGGPSFSPDGATIYFVSNRAGPWDVYRVPAVGGAAVRVTTGSGIVGKPAVSPDGGTLAYARSQNGATTDVVLLDLASGVVTPFAAGASEPAFDPAGGRLAIRAPDLLGAVIALAPLDGGAAARVTSGPGPDAGPAFAR